MAEAQTLSALFGSEDDLDLGALAAISQQGEGGPLSDLEMEGVLREQWGMAPLDTDGAAREIDRGQVSARPSDDDIDDFTDDEWLIVRAMRKICLAAIATNTPPKMRAKSIEWLFVRETQEPKTGASFHLSCEMLRARPWVIQALVQHFWFLRAITPNALPFMADPLPEGLQSEAIMHGWHAGMYVAASAWMKPGLPAQDLRNAVEEVNGEDFDRTVAALIDAGVLGSKVGRIYLTSRPASFRRQRGAVSWSSSFLGG